MKETRRVNRRASRAGLSGEVELATAHFAKALNQLSGILMEQLTRMISQLGKAILQSSSSGSAVTVFFGGSGQQLRSHNFQLALHFAVIGEVHLLELLDETDE